MVNDKPSLKRKTTSEKKPIKLDIPQLNIDSIPPIPLHTALLIISIIALLLVMLLTVNTPNETNTTNNTTEIIKNAEPTTVKIGNNSLGYVVKEGPYGNADSEVKIAYILGVHPREKGAHKLMEQAFKESDNNLSYCYYIYKINVTENPTDYSESRLNGQKLAYKYAVPDMINNNFTFAVDSHYSNGAWGVSRFIFTPRENNTLSSQLGHAITDYFDWISYYTPPNPTSPEYVTGPLNDGGVASIIYEAYTEDDTNTTLQHDKELVSFIDNWVFNNNGNATN